MIITVRRHRARTCLPAPLALAVSLCFAAPVHAQSVDSAAVLAPIVITGARFDSDPALLPIGATVITADQIRRAGVSDVNSAIRKIGGVYGRQSLDGSPDFTLDLRGFGTNSSQNLVIVVDGVRLSENELSNAVLSTIPIDTVDHIEITRGGSSVLYGDGATGGVINITTRRTAKNTRSGSLFVEGGQFHQGQLRLSGRQSWDGFAADASIGHTRTDNYRDNNDFKLTNFSGGLQWFSQLGRIGLRYEGSRQDSGLPGSLTETQFNANPRLATTPRDYGSLDNDRLTLSGSTRLAGWDVAAELSHREKTTRSAYFDYGGSSSTYTVKQDQFSPRLRQVREIGGLLNEVVAGVDLGHWSRVVDGTNAQTDASQRSKAIYLRDEVKFDPANNGRIAAGVRRELFDQDSGGSAIYSDSFGLNAWDLQASYAVVPSVDVYLKAGQSYRVANADENGYTPPVNVPLKPQTSHDLELGLSHAYKGYQLAARLFRHQLNNEIFYDPTMNFGYGTNTNLDPTKRQGFELDAEVPLAPGWSASAHYQHVKATFTEGANSGKEIVLVPKNVLSARLSWIPASGQSADIGAQWVDSQRYGDDFANSCSARIPSYTTLDARYARKFGQWEWALSGTNLTDKHYYSQAYSCIYGSNSGIYPSDGRQLKLSARYDF